MNSDIRKTVLWLEAQRDAGQLSDDLFTFIIKGCIALTMEQKLTPKLNRLETKLDSYLDRLRGTLQ
jgi:hypothetical protein